MKLVISFEHCGVVEVEMFDDSGICKSMEFTNYYTFIIIIFIQYTLPKDT